MPSTNGHGPKKAVLYARVSTEEQARSGYSLAQQMDVLRAYAVSEGFEVLEEVSDPGQSGASLERPGMDRVRDLVAAGGVSVVLAQDRDRFAREPAYHYLLKREFDERDTKIRSLNDRGDESPEGELTDGILDQLSKYERAKTAERTRRGMLKRVREGYVNVTRPKYGFRYNEKKDRLVIHKPEMIVVERIFRLAAEGHGLHAMQNRLYAENIPSSTGKPFWDIQMIKKVLGSDMYRPHTYSEIREFLSEAAAARLEPDKEYGIQWYNRQRVTVRSISELDGNGGRRYRKQRTFKWRPKEEWVAIPVPAYLSRDLVDRARTRSEANEAHERKHLSREWELRGLLRCSCGHKIGTRSTTDKEGRTYNYYVCRRRGADRKVSGCTQKSIRAHEIERAVWEFISCLLKDPAKILAGMERLIDQERAADTRDHAEEEKLWTEKIVECGRLRGRYQDQQAGGYMTLEELGSKLSELEETRTLAQQELRTLTARAERVEDLETDRDALIEHMTQTVPDALDELSGNERNAIYRMLRLEIVPGEEGYEISGAFCTSETTSAPRRPSEPPLKTPLNV